MRRLLDRLYSASGAVAAVFLAAICGVVLLQVGANIVDAVAGRITGSPVGLVIPSYAEFAGYFLVASSFFALAYTLRAGDHIRVSLLIGRLRPGPRRVIEIWCSASGALLSAYFAWYAVGLVLESFTYHDLSSGMVPVPLWIPQAAMAGGLIVLTIALADECLAVLRGRMPTYFRAETPGEPGAE